MEGLLSLESTKPARRAILEQCQAEELVAFEEKIGQFDGVWAKMQATFAALANEIGDYGELLKDCELRVNCDLIVRLCAMQEKLVNLRHAVTDLDSNIDLMKVKIGELNIVEATQEYLEQKQTCVDSFN